MRRRWWLLIAGLGVMAPIAYFAYQWYEREVLFVNCYSDKLYPLASRVDRFSRDHHRFPDKQALFANLSEKSRDWLGTCSGSKQPFILNPEISEISVESNRKVPLLWCPPGSHGRYVGAVVLSGGTIKAEIMTRTELNDLLAAVGSSVD